jgi:hypothetical protein
MRNSKSHPLRNLSSISRSDIAMFVLMLILASSVSAFLFTTRLQKADNAQPTKSPAKLCCGQDMDQPHFLAASFLQGNE